MITLTENDCKVIRDRLRDYLTKLEYELQRMAPKQYQSEWGKTTRKLTEKEVDNTLKALSYL